jgi:hypothetical protein
MPASRSSRRAENPTRSSAGISRRCPPASDGTTTSAIGSGDDRWRIMRVFFVGSRIERGVVELHQNGATSSAP